MIRDIFLFGVLIAAVSILYYSTISSFASVLGYDLGTDGTKMEQLNSDLNEAYTDVASYSNTGYGALNNVSVSPQQTEGVDIVTTLGRFATVVIKTFISAFTIPVTIVNALVLAMGLEVGYVVVAGFVLTAFSIMVVLEVLSIATRYPLDR